MAERRTKPLKRAHPVLEWLVALVGLAVVIGAVGVLVREALTPASAPDPTLRVIAVTRATDGWRVEIEAANRSRSTAMEVDVDAVLTPPAGEAETASATLDYVPGQGSTRFTLMFRSDPRQGELELTVGGWSEP